jgi:hypothetical protein
MDFYYQAQITIQMMIFDVVASEPKNLEGFYFGYLRDF